MRDPDLEELILPDRVHRRVYTDPHLFTLEMERVFRRAWLYVGHDSQIPEPGDYFATRLGSEPVLIVRQRDGGVRALANRCRHKGMQIAPDGARGRTSSFRCGYHGWLYGLDGALRAFPAAAGYKGAPVRAGHGDFGLDQGARVEAYRGFLFARLHKEGPSLAHWLGPLRSSLDNFVDRAPAGAVEVAGGVFRYRHKANWKFFVENTLDLLHPMVVHQSATRPAAALNAEHPDLSEADARAIAMLLPFEASYDFFEDMGQRGAPFGHGEVGNRLSMHSGYDLDKEYWASMVEAYGQDRAKEILAVSRSNSVLYPSIMFKAPVSLVRVVKPVAVDETVIETWHFRLKGAPDALLARNLHYSTLVNSCAGLVGPDDHEAYQRLQSGLAAQASDWVWLARHPGKEAPDAEGARAGPGSSDLVHRTMFAAWRDYMEAA